MAAGLRSAARNAPQRLWLGWQHQLALFGFRFPKQNFLSIQIVIIRCKDHIILLLVDVIVMDSWFWGLLWQWSLFSHVTWLVNSCENFDISDNWEHQFMPIIVIGQCMTLDSIHNSCYVWGCHPTCGVSVQEDGQVKFKQLDDSLGSMRENITHRVEATSCWPIFICQSHRRSLFTFPLPENQQYIFIL